MGTVPANTLTNGRGDDVAGHNRRQLLDDPRSAAEEPMVCMTLRWRRQSGAKPSLEGDSLVTGKYTGKLARPIIRVSLILRDYQVLTSRIP